jgi:hypothetical protein
LGQKTKQELSMKHKIILFLICIILLQSCNSQGIDLARLKFPIDKNTLITNKVEFKRDQCIYDPSLIGYEYTESNMLSFDYNNLSNSIDDNSATYCGKNYLKLLVDEELKKIQGYQLHTYTKDESITLFNSLKSKLGLPNYDDDNEIERHVIWENENLIYIFNISYDAKIQDIKTVDANLLVLNNQLEELILYINNATFYDDYLKERKKQNKSLKNYSYATFAKEEYSQGTNYYLKGTKGLK